MWNRMTIQPGSNNWLLLLTFGILGIWDLGRSILTILLEADVSDFMHAGLIQSSTLIIFQAGSICAYAGLVALNAQRLANDLREALSEIQTLEGFLPICANCKKIRDDRGFWKSVEEYIEHHTHAVMTHSICQECQNKLYPHLAQE